MMHATRKPDKKNHFEPAIAMSSTKIEWDQQKTDRYENVTLISTLLHIEHDDAHADEEMEGSVCISMKHWSILKTQN